VSVSVCVCVCLRGGGEFVVSKEKIYENLHLTSSYLFTSLLFRPDANA